MLGKLDEKQIETFLSSHCIGRLGCHYKGRTYVIPINYYYRDNEIYSHSGPGVKIEVMRGNNEVCFEVENIQDTFNWTTVIVWGTFEEVTDEIKKHQIMQGLIHRMMPLTNKPGEHPSHGIVSDERDMDIKIQPIIYRIKIFEKSGRFEEHHNF